MQILITDTSICIDLFYGNLLGLLSKLPYKFGVSDVILYDPKLFEIIKPTTKKIVNSGFSVYSIETSSVADVFTLAQKYKKPSIQDLFSLVTARDYKAILLTGDKNLRKTATLEKVDYRGILWLLDELLRHDVISYQTAIQSLKNMLSNKARLPKVECEKRFKEWQK